MASLAKLRTRWAAIGAACAVTLGGGTFGIVQASVSSGDRAVYVPITPVRVLDTRAGTPITNTTLKVVVEGSINLPSGSTEVVVPVDASAVALNFTVTEGQKNGQYGFVTAFPCTSDTDTPPNASSLNFESNVDIANAMNVTTSANGSICLYVYGTADLIVDIAGYYTDHNHDDRYYTETEVDTALTNKADITSLMAPITPSVPVTLDSAGQVGAETSIAIGTNGNPIISYHDSTNGDLKIAACNNPTCTTSTNTTIDSAGQVGDFTSIAIGTNGNPIISYHDSTNGDLKIAACNNPTCTTSTNTTIDSTGNVGQYTSIAIGINGNPIISYYDNWNGALKIAACNNPTCTTSTNTTIDSTGVVGTDSSITIGTNGNPIISYHDITNGVLKVAACNNPTCTTSTTTTIDSAGVVGYHISITIGTNGNPIISYYDIINGVLKVAACKNPTCTGTTELERSTNTTIDSGDAVGGYTSIAIGTNGNPIISYSDSTNGVLKVAACNNPTCTTSTNSTIDSNGNVGLYTSMTIGANGHPVISYYDATNGALKVFSPWWLTGGR
jgi:aspartate carbamoyltransferase regulatory subunit